MKGRQSARAVVFRDSSGTPVWRWNCRVPNCGADEWHGRWNDAYDHARGHLKRHESFGFSRPL